MKYVIYKVGSMDVPVIGPETVNHSDLVPEQHRMNVINAGFVTFAPGENKSPIGEDFEVIARVWGESKTLNAVSNRNRDVEILNKMLRY